MGYIAVIYVHEVVDPEIRGGLGNVPTLVIVFFYFLGSLFGAMMPWYTATYIAILFPGE